jgi:hypothetical protein
MTDEERRRAALDRLAEGFSWLELEWLEASAQAMQRQKERDIMTLNEHRQLFVRVSHEEGSAGE